MTDLEIRECDRALACLVMEPEDPSIGDIAEIIARHMALEREQARRMREALLRLCGACEFVDAAELSISPEQWYSRLTAAKRALAEEPR